MLLESEDAMSGSRLWKMLLLLGLFGWLPSLASAQEAGVPEIRWRYDYNVARKEALEKKLPIVIDFYTKICFYCTKMDMTTFRDPRVAGLINERFIPLKLDGDIEKNLTTFLGINAFPTFVLAGSDGKILHPPLVGYQDAPVFFEHLQRVLANNSEPDWMLRDHQLAVKLIQGKEYARAIGTLRRIVEDGKARPVQTASLKLLQDLEGLGQERLGKAKDLVAKGQLVEAMESVNDTLRIFPGLQVTRDGTELLARISQAPEMRNQQRGKRAQELLAQAQEFYKLKDYIPCLDRCEVLMASYGDLAEGAEASQISTAIKADPEWLQSACEVLGDRLGNLYLALADSLLRKGQPDRARFYLERVVRSFPGTRQAESAQIRLGQLAGMPARRVDIDAASNRP